MAKTPKSEENRGLRAIDGGRKAPKKAPTSMTLPPDVLAKIQHLVFDMASWRKPPASWTDGTRSPAEAMLRLAAIDSALQRQFDDLAEYVDTRPRSELPRSFADSPAECSDLLLNCLDRNAELSDTFDPILELCLSMYEEIEDDLLVATSSAHVAKSARDPQAYATALFNASKAHRTLRFIFRVAGELGCPLTESE
jgi:hypothetical protein